MGKALGADADSCAGWPQVVMVSVQPYPCSAELHPIVAMTESSVMIGEYSGRAVYPDGRVERIGARKRTRLDRRRLEAGEEIYRLDKFYKLVNGDGLTINGICSEQSAPAD